MFALWAGGTLSMRIAIAQSPARLSVDLVGDETRHTAERVRVIVQGGRADLDAIAERHHLQIVRRLHGAAVFLVNSSEMGALLADATIDHL